MKKIVAIQDISCFGKCSLTVALPIISACGIETAVIPTAVLSTHTGGFKNFTFRDLTDDLLAIARHWNSEGITVDAVYTGYLGSKAQVEIVKRSEESVKQVTIPEVGSYVQAYTCESGKAAKFVIPEDATEDDLLAFYDMLNIVLKRKFKIKITE